MVATCKPKKHKNIDDVILQGKIKVDKLSTQNITQEDTDAKLIDALGNLDKIEFINDKDEKIDVDLNGSLDGCRFKINVIDTNGSEITKKFKILKYETDKNGFAGAIIQNEDNGHNILWADGSKGFRHFFKSPKEIIKDWIVNDLWGIGRGKVFPQLESLYKFANKYMNPESGKEKIIIHEAIGQSMMGVGMSSLAFVNGFENTQFRTYSGCVTPKLLENVQKKWGDNKLNGSNLKSYYTPGEPLLNLIKPVMADNEFYMQEKILNKCATKVHSANAYFGYNTYYKITEFDDSHFPMWKLNPKASYDKNGKLVIQLDTTANDIPINQAIESVNDFLSAYDINDHSFIDENGNGYILMDIYPIMRANGVTRCDINPTQDPETPNNVIPKDWTIICPTTVDGPIIPKVKLKERNYKPLKDPIHPFQPKFKDAPGSNPEETDPIIIDLNGDGIKTTNIDCILTPSLIFFNRQFDYFRQCPF